MTHIFNHHLLFFKIWIVSFGSRLIQNNTDATFGEDEIIFSLVAISDEDLSFQKLLWFHGSCELSYFDLTKIFSKEIVFQKWDDFIQLFFGLLELGDFVEI